MSLFGKKDKKDEKPCCCGECDSESMAKAETAKTEGASVKVLGSGCTKCNQLEAAAKEALGQLGMDTTIDHVTDFSQIAAYGVMTTPALVVDGKVVSYGKVLKAEEIVKILQKVRQRVYPERSIPSGSFSLKVFYVVYVYFVRTCRNRPCNIVFQRPGQDETGTEKAWKSFENILPQILSVLIIIGLAMAIFSQETIVRLLGTRSGIWGVLAASVIGSITLIPGFVAFPLAAALLNNGAGYMQIAAFVSTLMMVGIVTLPVEMKTFGKRATIIRNLSAFVFSLIAAFVIGTVL